MAGIGPSISLKGEKEFRQAISAINSEMKVLGSEMNKVTAEFSDNSKSVDALKARNEVLNKEIEKQTDKVSLLKGALAEAEKQYGENDKRTLNWKSSLNNAEAELTKLTKEVDKNEKEIGESSKGFKDMGNEVEKSKDKVSNFGAAFGKVMAGIAAATAAAGVALVKNVIENFSELEQNIGGAEAVFGEYADTIKNKGAEAYKTLGASQSDYLATANKMGALFQGSGLDQEKSLNLTVQAMQRAADMASVMGIDIQVALDSVTGAAKGNFTMMDNLGVAMNATNIEAYALAKGLDFTWASATQAEKAEVAMQMFFENTEQYAGNFAKESTQTISGSIGMMEAAMSSFIAGLGDSNADMTLLTSNVIDSFGSVVDNIVPVIENITKSLPEVLNTIIAAITDMLPPLLDAAMELFTQVLQAIETALPQIIPVIIDAVMMIVNTLINNLDLIIETAITLVLTLVDGLTKAIPELIPAIIQAVMTIVKTLLDNLPELVRAALKMILALAKGLVDAIPQLIEAIPEIIESLIQAIVEMLPEIISMGVTLVIELGKGLIKAIPALIKNIPEIIKSLINGFKNGIANFRGIGGDLISGLWQGIEDSLSWLWNKITDVANTIGNWFKDVFQIGSPSKLFADEIGANLGLGIGVGFEDVMKDVSRDMAAAVPTDFDLNANVTGGGGMKSEIHLHIGTLVADEWGLKELERKLKNVRVQESYRLAGGLA